MISYGHSRGIKAECSVHGEDGQKRRPKLPSGWREFRGLTQEALAEKVKTTGSVISMLEAGERQLSSKWLRKLAPALRTRPGFMLDFDPNDLDADLIEIWVNANQEQRRQLVDVAKAVMRKAG